MREALAGQTTPDSPLQQVHESLSRGFVGVASNPAGATSSDACDGNITHHAHHDRSRSYGREGAQAPEQGRGQEHGPGRFRAAGLVSKGTGRTPSESRWPDVDRQGFGPAFG